MHLILIRHGNALNHDIDALRPLSDQGKAEAKETGLFLQSEFKNKAGYLLQSGGPLKLIHSELLRAKETALLVAGQLSHNPQLEEGKDLQPQSNPNVWKNNLMAFNEQDTIILVGHMPFMGIFASELCDCPLSLPTGGCLILKRDESNMTFSLQNKNF